MKSKKTSIIKPKPIRLSTEIIPTHYTIELFPDLEARLFSGTAGAR